MLNEVNNLIKLNIEKKTIKFNMIKKLNKQTKAHGSVGSVRSVGSVGSVRSVRSVSGGSSAHRGSSSGAAPTSYPLTSIGLDGDSRSGE